LKCFGPLALKGTLRFEAKQFSEEQRQTEHKFQKHLQVYSKETPTVPSTDDF